jgi:membrane-associated phospholipid phosphatase
MASYCNRSISLGGLFEAGKNIGKLIAVFIASVTTALMFWYIRAWIPTTVDSSYYDYAVFLDSALIGVLPSLWLQQNFRFEFLDVFLRYVWLSYSIIILFGSTLAYCLRTEAIRHFWAVAITLSSGLIIHYFLPTQPPWMAVDEVLRINGEYFSKLDKNLVAAMPSIHQAITCLAGCILWRYRKWGRIFAITYNLLMATSLVYLGEHYLIDSIAGIYIALQSWYLSKKLIHFYQSKSAFRALPIMSKI